MLSCPRHSIRSVFRPKRWDCIVAICSMNSAFCFNIDDALIEGLSQNQDFFTLLLQNEEIKKEVLGIFADEIYKSLRKEG